MRLAALLVGGALLAGCAPIHPLEVVEAVDNDPSGTHLGRACQALNRDMPGDVQDEVFAAAFTVMVAEAGRHARAGDHHALALHLEALRKDVAHGSITDISQWHLEQVAEICGPHWAAQPRN